MEEVRRLKKYGRRGTAELFIFVHSSKRTTNTTPYSLLLFLIDQEQLEGISNIFAVTFSHKQTALTLHSHKERVFGVQHTSW